jgi:hypothetical protein
MRPGNERAFPAGDPVATYWLHNCVGFDVRGLRGAAGVVHEVGADADGEPVLAIRRPVLGTTYVAASRVSEIDPWNETIVLRSRERALRPVHSSEQAGRAGRAAASAGHAAAIVAAAAARRFSSAVARLLLAVAADLRAHAPGARRRAGSAATMLAALGAAYAGEARRAYGRQREAMNAWRASRRRDSWGDEAPLTRAGADDVDAREEERVGR